MSQGLGSAAAERGADDSLQFVTFHPKMQAVYRGAQGASALTLPWTLGQSDAPPALVFVRNPFFQAGEWGPHHLEPLFVGYMCGGVNRKSSGSLGQRPELLGSPNPSGSVILELQEVSSFFPNHDKESPGEILRHTLGHQNHIWRHGC